MIPLEYLLASSTHENLSDSPPKKPDRISNMSTLQPRPSWNPCLSVLLVLSEGNQKESGSGCLSLMANPTHKKPSVVVILPGWSHPFETYLSTWESSQIGVNMKRVWNHHLGFAWLNKNKPNIFTIEMTKGDMETRIQVRRFIGNLIPPRPLKPSWFMMSHSFNDHFRMEFSYDFLESGVSKIRDLS